MLERMYSNVVRNYYGHTHANKEKSMDTEVSNPVF